MIRKITSRQDEEKKRRRNQIIVGLVLVSVMLFSTLAYSFGTSTRQQETKINYNNYEFTYLNGLWNVNVGVDAFGFINNPSIAYKVDSNVNPLIGYYGKPLYLYSEDQNSEAEVYRNLYPIATEVTSACPEGNNSCDNSLPVKTCQDNFIIIREKGEAKVTQQEKCVFIEGTAADLAKITDGFLLKVIGIQ